MKTIAKWESRNGHHAVELVDYEDGAYGYSGRGCGGCLGVMTREAAIARIESMVVQGYFLPDAAKRPMRRTL